MCNRLHFKKIPKGGLHKSQKMSKLSLLQGVIIRLYETWIGLVKESKSNKGTAE